MKDFFENISRFPRYLLSLVVWVFIAFFGWMKPLLKNPVTAVAVVGILIGGFAFLYFTLQAMLGLN